MIVVSWPGYFIPEHVLQKNAINLLGHPFLLKHLVLHDVGRRQRHGSLLLHCTLSTLGIQAQNLEPMQTFICYKLLLLLQSMFQFQLQCYNTADVTAAGISFSPTTWGRPWQRWACVVPQPPPAIVQAWGLRWGSAPGAQVAWLFHPPACNACSTGTS